MAISKALIGKPKASKWTRFSGQIPEVSPYIGYAGTGGDITNIASSFLKGYAGARGVGEDIKAEQDYQKQLQEQQAFENQLAQEKASQPGEIKGEFLNAVSLINDPNFGVNYSPEQQQRIIDFANTKAKGFDTLRSQTRATTEPKLQLEQQYKPETAGLVAQQQIAGQLPQAQELERQKFIGRTGLQQTPTGGLSPIEGSPEDLARQKAEQELINQAKLESQQQEVIGTNVDNAIRVLSEPSFLPKAGTGSNIVSMFTNTKASELESYLDSIRSNVALNKLIEVKKAGGTFGALQKNEMDALEASFGKLKTVQNPEVLKQNLLVVKKFLGKAQDSAGGNLEMALDNTLSQLQGGSSQQEQTATNPNTGETIVFRNGKWEAM